MKKMRREFSSIDFFMKYVPSEARRNDCRIINAFGREYYIPELKHPDEKIRRHAERKAVNSIIQGVAGQITIRTLILTRKLIENFGLKDRIKLLNTVHDSFAYSVDPEYLDWFRDAFVKIATRKIPQIKNFSFPVAVGIGNNWSEAEENSK